MMKAAVLLAIAGAALTTACSDPGGTDNNALAVDGNVLSNVAGDIAPLNQAVQAPAATDSAGASSNAAGQPAPARPGPATAARPEPAPKAQADRPARAESRAPRPAPKQEPAPAPTSSCTPELEAMGHCKQ